VIKGKPFKVELELCGWAARFAAERRWSPDQKIKELGHGKILLAFAASSEPEVVSWTLWMGEEAKLRKPLRLRKKMIATIENMARQYAS
jgi:predicted DNA-binding transcriptional regulator YafY